MGTVGIRLRNYMLELSSSEAQLDILHKDPV